MIQAGIIGATGYVGDQLAGLLYHQSQCEIHFMTSHSYADMEYSKVYGQYKGFIDERCINIQDIDSYLEETDIVFFALPHGKTFDIARKCLDRGIKIIDMGADFRLKS